MHEIRNPDEKLESSAPLRVVHVVQNLKGGGAETLVRGLCSGLAREGVDVTVVSIYSDALEPTERAALGFPVISLGRRGRTDLSFFPRLVATLRELRPDVVHAHLHAGKYAGRLAALAAHTPALVFTEHGDEAGGALRAAVNRLLHPRTTRFVTFNDAQRRRFSVAEGVPLERIAVIPNGINAPPAADRDALRTALGMAPDTFAAYLPARLTAQKNQTLAVRAFARAWPGDARRHLYLAGKGPLEAELHALVRELELGERVHFLGFRNDAPALCRAMDVFLMTSVWERMPLALGEAMRAGLAVVTTPWAGFEDFVHDGETGFVAQTGGAGDVEAFATALVRADDDIARRRVADRARAFADERFDLATSVRGHVALYGALARANEPSRGKRLAYVTARMPFAFAEQFFEPEIDSLAATFDVTVIPTRATSAANRYPDLKATAHYLGLLDGNVVRLALAEFKRAPGAVFAALRTVAFARCAVRARAVNLLLFPKALALAADLRRLRIEHIHVNWMTSSATIAYVASRLTGIPLSITAHQHDIFYDNLLREKVERAEFVRVISARNCRHLQDLLPRGLRAKCRVVHLGVELPQAPLQAPERSPRILCSARMCEWKGHRYLLEALAALRDRGVAFACDLAGDGEISAAVAKQITDLRLGERVTMLGNVPHAALVASLERAVYDIVVLASTERDGEHEGIPVALMEAMAVGLPVVATRTGSIGELVDESSGILVEQANPVALASALERLLGDPPLRARLGEHGRERVLAHFSTAQTTHELSELLLAAAPWHERRVVVLDEGLKSLC